MEVRHVMLAAAEVAAREVGKGFERVELVHGTSYKDCSTVILIPTRGTIHHRVVQAWDGLIAPMNQKRAKLYAVGHEVGKAYDALLAQVLADPNLSSWRYVLTLEDDNLPPPDAHIRLIESIEQHGLDAVSGIYFTKGDFNMPMAYGDPAAASFDFRPRDIREALGAGSLMRVNGIAMGCALWRMDLFRKVAAPWFVTVADLTPEGPKSYTQDLFFCERAARQHGAKFGVDMRVKVGHLDVATGEVY